jgi:FKBP-type peptidyl-prolyl cis-trans isomerase FkpA/FKBP-type peptidyl-prolyl cis-trans isomerase FklB
LSLAACALAVTGGSLQADASLETDEQRILYTVGIALSRSLASYGLTEGEVALIQRGLADGVLARPHAAELETYGPQIEGFLAARRSALIDKEKEAGAAFASSAAKETGASLLASGLVYLEIEPGSGSAPSGADTVKVHYHGTLRDGTVFDTSRVEGGEPATFALAEVVPCFSEGILKMRVGGKSKLVCPSDLAYGDRGFPPMIPPGATLTFEIELLEIAVPGVGAAPSPSP